MVVKIGTFGNDLLLGSNGADTLQGSFGDDTLRGFKGSDVLVGGGDDDTLEGGKGSDSLYGDAGDDHLDGGSGVDKAVFNTAGDVEVSLNVWHRHQQPGRRHAGARRERHHRRR